MKKFGFSEENPKKSTNENMYNEKPQLVGEPTPGRRTSASTSDRINQKVENHNPIFKVGLYNTLREIWLFGVNNNNAFYTNSNVLYSS